MVMKKSALILTTLIAAGAPKAGLAAPSLEGAWSYIDGQTHHLAVFVDGYFSHTAYDLDGKQFISTRGGTYDTETTSAEATIVRVVWQYDTDKSAHAVPPETWLGTKAEFSVAFVQENEGQIRSDIAGETQAWARLDRNDGPLAGVWRISGRKQEGEITPMALGDRRTLKILTGSTFQWVAIHIGTGQFLGTGGGSYTFEDGKYTEKIAFFSRDHSRVGASLSFDGKVEEGHWHHSGLSSTGNPIYEIWSPLEGKEN